MDDYTKYIILNHLHWIEKGITGDDISKCYSTIKDKDIFSGVNMHQLQENMGYKFNFKEVITLNDFEKIKFLWLSLSRFKMDLSFVKFCTNLEEINIGCFDEVNLDVLRENTKLKYIIANGNKIRNIEALYAHSYLEELNIENNPCCSLKPIAHLKNLKKIEVDLIEDEIDALTIVKNNLTCTVDYLISGSPTNFDEFIFPFYHINIHKEEKQISFFIEATEKADKFTEELRIPKELMLLKSFKDKYFAAVQNELLFRLRTILDYDVMLHIENIIFYNELYMIEYTHPL